MGPKRGNICSDGRTDVQTDEREETHPCVLKDNGPLRPLPIKVYPYVSKMEANLTQFGMYEDVREIPQKVNISSAP